LIIHFCASYLDKVCFNSDNCFFNALPALMVSTDDIADFVLLNDSASFGDILPLMAFTGALTLFNTLLQYDLHVSLQKPVTDCLPIGLLQPMQTGSFRF
jgi:hypothetical protein